MVCASWFYPKGTVLRVTELHNGLSVMVKVIERGPNHRLKRQIDLSRLAFSQMDGLALGIAEVKIERVK